MLAWCDAECSLCDLRSEYLIFSILFNFPLFPLIRQLFPNSDATHPLLYPVVRIALGLIQSPCPFRCQFRVFNLLHPLIACLCQPAFEGLSLGRGDGLDDAENSFSMGTVCFSQLPVGRGQLQPVTKCHDFTSFIFKSLFQFPPICPCIGTFSQHITYIYYRKPPLIVMQCPSDLPSFENC